MSEDKRKLVGNERAKLLANALDRAATTCFTVGIATPLAGYIYNLAGVRDAVSPARLMAGVAGWLAAAVILHMTAQRVLGRLR